MNGSGGLLRRAFSFRPLRCEDGWAAHDSVAPEMCSTLSDAQAVQARRELHSIAEILWEVPPVVMLPKFWYASVKKLSTDYVCCQMPSGGWKDNVHRRLVAASTKRPILYNETVARNLLNSSHGRMATQSGRYMHPVYIKIRTL